MRGNSGNDCWRRLVWCGAIALAACTAPVEEGLEPLALTTDLTVQTVARASCTRGNSPVMLRAGSEGALQGTIVGSRANFTGTMIARDPGTVVLVVERGSINNERLEEAMQPTAESGEVLLRGPTFTCKDVQVRLPQ